MALTETQCKVLLEIGSNEGKSAYTIAPKLKMDQGGINRVCGKLRGWGLVSATEKTKKGVNSNELKLTLLGFALTLVTSHDNAWHEHKKSGDYRGTSEENKNFDSLLRNNRDLHESLEIFYEYFSYYTPQDLSYSCIALLPLVGVLRRYSESYGFQAKHSPTNLGKLEWDDSIGSSLYKDLFFSFWEIVENQNIIRKDTQGDRMGFFTTDLLPRFRESKGWPDIARELKLREDRCEQLRILKNLVY